jgi:hypothetical protein
VINLNYTFTTKDYGQGSGLTAMPVSSHAGKRIPTGDRPYSAYEVLTDYFEEDMGLVIGNYLKMEIEKVHDAGVMKQAQALRLMSYAYRMTRSRIQQGTADTVVDFIIQGKLEGTDENNKKMYGAADFRVRYILDLKPCSQKCVGPIIGIYKGDDKYLNQYPIATNEYLLPILYNKDYETVAHDILSQYFPELGTSIGLKGFCLKADELANRMGLEVHDVKFHDPTILGQLYYNRASAELLDSQGRLQLVPVKPGTILISSDNCSTPGVRNSTIVHECAHMYLDRWFFLLQMMAGNKKAAYTNRRKAQRHSFTNKTAVEWMELQCDKLPAYLLLECSSTKAFIEESLKKNADKPSTEAMRNTISAVMEHFQVSFAMARYRMIELGYQEAEGINCYIDNMVIPDHGCSGKWKDGVTYTISVKDAIDLSEREARFAELISNGRFRYAEGHFCRNDRKYLEFDYSGRIRLTAYARQHMDECCLGFYKCGKARDSRYQLGIVSRNRTEPVTDKYMPGYSLAAEPDTEEYGKENKIFSDDCWLWGDFYYDMSDDYKEAIMDIMKKKGLTQEFLANELNVDRKVVYNCLNAMNPSKPHLVAICVALKLPSFVSEKILSNAGITFRRTDLDHLYRTFLLKAEQLTVERCDDILRQNKFPTLFERAA